jgi:hypothetical protein
VRFFLGALRGEYLHFDLNALEISLDLGMLRVQVVDACV